MAQDERLGVGATEMVVGAPSAAVGSYYVYLYLYLYGMTVR